MRMKIRFGQAVECYSRRAAFVALFAVFILGQIVLPPVGMDGGGNAVQAAPATLQPLEIITKSGHVKISIEVASTPVEQARGLMFRRSLGLRHGMLFVYKFAQEITMWMRNTYIPLDMVFIGADGRVRNIVRDTEPFSEKIIHSGGDVTAVLEIAGGQASALNIQLGDLVIHPHFEK